MAKAAAGVGTNRAGGGGQSGLDPLADREKPAMLSLDRWPVRQDLVEVKLRHQRLSALQEAAGANSPFVLSTVAYSPSRHSPKAPLPST